MQYAVVVYRDVRVKKDEELTSYREHCEVNRCSQGVLQEALLRNRYSGYCGYSGFPPQLDVAPSHWLQVFSTAVGGAAFPNFTNNVQEIKAWLTKLEPKDGGDAAEDMAGGLLRVCVPYICFRSQSGVPMLTGKTITFVIYAPAGKGHAHFAP